MAIEQSYNFRRVDDRITTSGVVPKEVLEEMGNEGYGLMINLLPQGGRYSVPDEQVIMEGQKIDYVYIPVDFGAPTLEDFDAFTSAMQAAGERKVHIHCAANFRVSAFYSRYAVRQGRWSEAEAGAFVAGLWDPAENPGWPEFIEAVRARD